MHVAAAKVTLHIHASGSLKDKRRVVHSVVSQLRNRLGVSAAEVDVNDTWQSATIGVAIASSDIPTLDRLLERVLPLVERIAPGAEVIDVESDVWSFDAG